MEKVHSPSSYKIQNKKINVNDLNEGRDPADWDVTSEKSNVALESETI